MSYLILKTGGIFVLDGSLAEPQSLNPYLLLSYLDHEIYVEGDATLLDLFGYINRGGVSCVRQVGQTFNKDLPLFISNLLAETDVYSTLSYLRVGEFAELFKPTNGFPWFNHFSELNGWVDGESTVYSVNMVPVNTLKNLPLRVAKNAKLNIIDWVAKTEESHNYVPKITLRSFLSAILTELTFVGKDSDKELLTKGRSQVEQLEKFLTDIELLIKEDDQC